MKKITLIIFAFLLIGGLQSQSFYYSEGERVELFETFGEGILLKNGEISPMLLAAGEVPLWVTTEIVLDMKDGEDIESLGYPYERFSGGYILTLSTIDSVVLVSNRIYESGIVEYCHPNFIAPPTLFSDPLYGEQFQMHNTGQVIDGFPGSPDCDIDAPEAWNITTGSADVLVCVIDDGIDGHQDLHDDLGNSRILGGFTPGGPGGVGLPIASGKHGIPCAGIIAASHNNVGIKGVAPESRLLSVNIFAGGQSVSDIAEGFYWAVDNGADIISNSWGYNSCNMSFSVLTNAINHAVNNGRDGKGCVVVFASGNNNSSCVSYPAKLEGVIAVGAVTNQCTRSYYSNYGPSLDVVAPSNGKAGVRTTDRMGVPGYVIGDYHLGFGGTSAACPAVSGVAALLLAYDDELSSSEVYEVLTSTATDMGTPGFDYPFGYGRVSAYDALQCLIDGDCESSGGSGGGNPIVCDTATNFTLDYVGNTVAAFSWDPVPNAESYSLRYRKFPSNSWAVKAYLTATEAVVTGLTPGITYRAELVVHCGNNNNSDWTETIEFIPGTTSSAGEVENLGDYVRIFPNPTKGELYIESDYEILSVAVYNSVGELKEEEFRYLEQGAYFVVVRTVKGSVVRTIVKI